MNGALAASHVTKGDNLGTGLASRLPSALMVKVRNRNLVILTSAQASITSMPEKRLSRESVTNVMYRLCTDCGAIVLAKLSLSPSWRYFERI